jgi:hypothetical protein
LRRFQSEGGVVIAAVAPEGSFRYCRHGPDIADAEAQVLCQGEVRGWIVRSSVNGRT